ncbi:MAG: ABC transporter ATP-binding protein [Syntrophomonadaceae bacterium]
MPVLMLEKVSQEFGGLRALDGIDLSVEEKSIYGIIGPNGAGKTTLFNLITGIYHPSEGKISFRDRRLDGLTSYRVARLGIGRTFQNIRLFNRLSVEDNVRVATGWNGGILARLFSRSEANRADEKSSYEVGDLLGMMGLYEKRQEYANSLSYGEQRRLEIARALAGRPSLLLLDEPAAGMNSTEKVELMGLIQQMRDEMHLTILLVEHDMQLVMNICEQIAVLDYGRKIAEGSPNEVKNNPLVIQSYLGVEQ